MFRYLFAFHLVNIMLKASTFEKTAIYVFFFVTLHFRLTNKTD